MLAAEVVLVALERLGEGAMLELVGEIQPAFVAGVGVEIGEDLVHAAELGVEHALDLGVAHSGQNALGPGGELDFELERGPVAGETVGIAQAGVGLVQRVPRRPHAVEVETAGADVALGDLLEEGGRRPCPSDP